MKKLITILFMFGITVSISGCHYVANTPFRYISNGMKEEDFKIKYAQEHPEIKKLLQSENECKSKVGCLEFTPTSQEDKDIWNKYLSAKQIYLTKKD
jgi:hypothetical protein